MTDLLIPDLIPNTEYAIEVRAVRTNGVSEWSPKFGFVTENDTVLPLAPTSVTWAVSGDSFAGSWDTSTLNVNGEIINIVRYEVELVAASLTRIVSVPQTTGSTVYFNFSFDDNRALFGSPQPSVQMRVRAVSNIDTKSSWTSALNASNPVPAAPTGVTATAGPNQIALTWTPPADNDVIGYNVYYGATLVTFINATSWIFYTSGYIATVLTVKSVDKFNQESSGANSNSVTPLNPAFVDVTAPSTPTSLAATITNNSNGIGARAAVSWVMSSPPSDLAGYYIRFRKVGDTNYSNVTFSKDVLAGIIELQSAYQNYEFQIKAFDWSQNESAWSSTVTATSPSNAAPANVTGLVSTPGRDAITYSWTAVADTDIKNYEVTFSTSATFASGNITYLTGEATTLTVGGLSPSTTYYARVRAVDNSGLTSAAWSSTDTETTTAFPTPPPSDTYAPQSSPTPNVLGGLSYLYVTWSPVTLNSNGGTQVDPVTYEVHLSTSTGFTPSGATKVTEVSGTSAIVDILPGTTTPLSYGTTYFIKLIAKDRDGAAAAGSQGSGSISKVASTDVTSIGADLIVPGSGFINNLVMNTGGSIQSANYVAATSGYKLDTSGLEINNGSVKASLLTAGTLTSSTGVIQIGSGASLVLNGGYLKSNTYTGTSYNAGATAGFYLGNDGLVIAQGTVKAEAFAGGSFTAGTITMGAGGSITGGSWTLNSSGLTIPNGAINAAALNIQIGANAMPAKYADFEAMASAYPAFPTVLGIGGSTAATISTAQKYNNTQSLNVVSTAGASNRGWLLAGSQTDYNILVNSSTRYIVSAYLWNNSGVAVTGYLGIKQQDGSYVNGTATSFANTAGWVRYSTVVTTTSAASAALATFTVTNNANFYIDCVQIEQAINSTVTTPSPWAPPGATSINGDLIRTGAIQSNVVGNVWDAGTESYIAGTNPAWLIDISGDAVFSSLSVLGAVVVGDPTDPDHSDKYIIGSAFYIPGEQGWIMHGDGWVEFNQIVADTINGNSIIAGTLAVDKLSTGVLGANISVVGGGGLDFYVAGESPDLGDLPMITINPNDGLIIDPPGTGYIQVPSSASLPIIIRDVSLTATDAKFSGNVQIWGSANYISGNVMLEKSISDPASPPAVTSGWSDPSTYLSTTPPAGYSTFGLTEDTTGSYWVTGICAEASKNGQIHKINKTTGAYTTHAGNMTLTNTVTYSSGGYNYSGTVTRGPDRVRGVGKIVVTGTTYYAVLVRYAAQSGTITSTPTNPPPGRITPTTWPYSLPEVWEVRLYNSATTYISGQAPASKWTWTKPASTSMPYLSSDGTNLYIAYAGSSSPYNFTVVRYAYNGGSATTVASSTGGGVNTDITCVWYGAADTGLNRYYVGGSQLAIWSLSGTGVGNDTATTFSKANGENAWGLYWDGTQFRSITATGKIYKYSTYTSATVTKSFKYTWYDSDINPTADPDPDVNGTHESLASPAVNFSVERRGWFKVTTGTPADNGYNNDPDSIRLYIDDWRQTDWGAGVITQLYSTHATSGTNYSTLTVNQFEALAAPGEIISRQTMDNSAIGGGALDPVISVRGDGAWRLGNLTGDGTGALTQPAGGITFASKTWASGWSRVSTTASNDTAQPMRGGFTTSGSSLIIPVTGWYAVFGQVAFTTGSAGTVARRGIGIGTGSSMAADDVQNIVAWGNNASGQASVSGFRYLTANDALSLFVYSDLTNHYGAANTGVLRAVLVG